ncbi:hypothetical protein TNCT_635601 [Trichonephila clavata]|uniref:Uncharacterized protein n=1 Tax=Trichonephila clavata TaxID=2740835 RepID=A0A8X6H9C3_TRICU|nr:hypothetical protein TNCT_635601 [Trichonephila clavata]
MRSAQFTFTLAALSTLSLAIRSQKWLYLAEDQDFGREAEKLVTSPSPRQRRDGNAIGCRGLLQMPPMRMRRSPVHLASGESVSEDGKDGFLADAPPHALRAALAQREGRQPITWPFHSTREDERLEHESPAAARRAPAFGNESPLSLLLKTLRCVCARWSHSASYGKKRAIAGALPTTWFSPPDYLSVIGVCFRFLGFSFL